MSEKSELKSCPFCGAKPNVRTDVETRKIVIYCPHQPCRCEALGWSNNEVETQWNTRAVDPDVARLAEALEGMLDGLDANVDERCGLTNQQWDKRLSQARKVLDELKL
jgi:hypothetical protein